MYVVLPQEHLPGPAQAGDEGCPALLPARRAGAVLTPIPAGAAFSPQRHCFLSHLLVKSRLQPCRCQACCWVLLPGAPPAAAPLSARSREGVQTPTRPPLGQGLPHPLFSAPCPAAGCENRGSFALRCEPGVQHGLGLTDTGSAFSRNLFN